MSVFCSKLYKPFGILTSKNFQFGEERARELHITAQRYVVQSCKNVLSSRSWEKGEASARADGGGFMQKMDF